MREVERLFSSFSFWLGNNTLWRQLLKWLLTLDYIASCEGFSTSGNAVFTSQEHATRTKVAYNLLDGMNRLAMDHGYYMYIIQLHRAQLYTLSLHYDGLALTAKKQEADSSDKGGFNSVLHVWAPTSSGERQMIHSTSSLLKWVAVIVLILDTEALWLVHR